MFSSWVTFCFDLSLRVPSSVLFLLLLVPHHFSSPSIVLAMYIWCQFLITICQSSVCLFLWVPSYSWVCLHWPCGLFHFDHFNNQYSQSALCYIFHESESALGSTFLTTCQPHRYSKGIFIFNWKLWQYKYISNSTSYRNNLNLGSTPQKPLFTGRILSDLMQNTQKHKSEVYVCMCATQPSYLGAETKTLNQKIC